MVPRPRVDRDGPRRVDERPLLGKQFVDGSCIVCDKTCLPRPGLEHISSRLRSMDGHCLTSASSNAAGIAPLV